MKLGMNTTLQHRTPEEWGAKHKSFECTSVVFPVDYLSDTKTIDEYVKVAKEHQFVIAEVGAWSNPLSFDEKIRAEAIEKCVEQLKLADYVGSNCCVNIGGSAGVIWDCYHPDNFSKAFYERMVTTIQKIIDLADPKNTFYCIEPMPWMIPTGPEEYEKLIADVDRKQFGVHMDMTNWINGGDRYFHQREFMDRCYEKLGKYIKSCHLKDSHMKPEYTFQVEEVACGKGEQDMEYYCELTNKVDPNLPMLIEHLKDDEAYIESFAYVKERFKKYL